MTLGRLGRGNHCGKIALNALNAIVPKSETRDINDAMRRMSTATMVPESPGGTGTSGPDLQPQPGSAGPQGGPSHSPRVPLGERAPPPAERFGLLTKCVRHTVTAEAVFHRGSGGRPEAGGDPGASLRQPGGRRRPLTTVYDHVFLLLDCSTYGCHALDSFVRLFMALVWMKHR